MGRLTLASPVLNLDGDLRFPAVRFRRKIHGRTHEARRAAFRIRIVDGQRIVCERVRVRARVHAKFSLDFPVTDSKLHFQLRDREIYLASANGKRQKGPWCKFNMFGVAYVSLLNLLVLSSLICERHRQRLE